MVAQLDGYCLLHIKQRISHDLHGTSSEHHCLTFGDTKHSPSSEVLFINPIISHASLKTAAATAASTQCKGVAILPVWPPPPGAATDGHWWHIFHEAALAIINIRATAGLFRTSACSPSPAPPWGLRAIVFNLQRCQRRPPPSASPHAEVGPLSLRELDDTNWPCLPAVPFFLPKLLNLSAASGSSIPLAGQHGSPPLPVSQLIPVPPLCPPQLNIKEVARAARSYPHRETGLFVAAGVRDGFPSFFQGDRSIHVDLPNMPSAALAQGELRENALKERVKGRYLGPFRSNPFPNWWCPHQPRNAPAGAVPKNRSTPLDGIKRPVANFSALAEWSVNSLDGEPGVQVLWMTFERVLAAVADCGRNTIIVAADVKSAYRLNRNQLQDLHLHVHKLDSPNHGQEFFVDLCNPFGFKNSYWNWESLAGVVKWRLLRGGLRSVCNFVDNFFLLVPPCGDGSPDTAGALLTQKKFLQTMEALGLPMHEHQVGTSGITCLGWIIDTTEWTFRCPPPRLQLVTNLLQRWAAKSTCSLKELRSITGLFYFISAGFSAGRADLAHFFKLKAKGEATARRLKKSPASVFLKLSPQVAASLEFWHSFFPSWDGAALIQASPSPLSSWDSIWRSDGSTSWGMGATNSRRCEYISSPWTPAEMAASARKERESAPFLETLAALITVQTWAPGARGRLVLFELDCLPAQQALSAGYSAAPGMPQLLRALRLVLIAHSCTVIFRHIPRDLNTVADAFSTGAVQKGLQAWKHPAQTPAKVHRSIDGFPL